MFELDMPLADAVGGGSLFSLASIYSAGERVVSGLAAGINAGGATLRNYYGDETTLSIFAAGNMGA